MEQYLKEIDPLVFLGVGVLAFGINYLASFEVKKIQNNESLKAGIASAANVLLGSVLLYAFIANPINSISEMLGAFSGTLLMVERYKRHGGPRNPTN